MVICHLTYQNVFSHCLLYRSIRNFGDYVKLQQELNNLNIWADKWGMEFNVKKCYHLSVRQKSPNFYTMNGHIILKQVEEFFYLGITFSDNMKWNTRINQVRKKNLPWTFLKEETFIIHHKNVFSYIIHLKYVHQNLVY